MVPWDRILKVARNLAYGGAVIFAFFWIYGALNPPDTSACNGGDGCTFEEALGQGLGEGMHEAFQALFAVMTLALAGLGGLVHYAIVRRRAQATRSESASRRNEGTVIYGPARDRP